MPRRSKGRTASFKELSNDLLVAFRGGTLEDVSQRTVFFVSDQTGVTAETLGHSLLTQFDGLEFRPVTLPFVSTVDKAEEAVRRINRAAEEEGVRPIVFSTLVQDEVRSVVMRANGLVLDFFEAFVGPLERELNTRSTHRAGRAHGIADLAQYTTRINATNFALANDDGTGGDYEHADVILIGVSRSGKTPTCLYMALQYGIFAANYPLTDDDLEAGTLPARLEPHRRKLYALTIRPERLQQIRNERRPSSRYASPQQVQYEVRAAEAMFARYAIPVLDTTECSIEEIASRILNNTGIERRLRP
jgi:regulator of PEP synthase PpsR (kinase-PPPase family)